MTNPSKAFRRLGMVGAAAVVGLVPVALAGGTAAFATVSNANLTVTPTTTSSSSTVVDSFTTGTDLPAAGTINLVSTDNSGCPVGLPAGTALSTTTTPSDYTVTFTSGGATTTETGTVTVGGSASCTVNGTTTTISGTTAAIKVDTAIPAGSSVTVTISKATNPPTASGVFFQDSTSTDTQVIDTNVVSITAPAVTPVSTPGVNSVNPTAYTNASGEPFTVTGTNFSTQYGSNTASGGAYSPDPTAANYGGTTPSPVVCFVESTTTAPAASTSNPCAAPATTSANVVTSAPATITAISPGEIQGTSPVLTAGHSYNVVVYNYNGAASPKTYTAASGTNSQTLVGVANDLNVVPEAGVRVVDSRAGLSLPRGALTPGTTPVAIPLSTFAQSLTLPTNLPDNYTGLSVNVTAVAPASGGNIQMWTAATCQNGLDPTLHGGSVEPATVNFQPPQDTNNSQIIPVATPGSTTSPSADDLCVQDNGAPVSVVVDVVGYTMPDSGYTLSNTRLLDTRPATQKGSLQGPLQSNTVYQVPVCTYGFFPNPTNLPGCNTTPVAFNVADVAPSAPGNLRVFPEPASGPPAASAVPNAAVDNYIVNTDASAMIITTITPNTNTGIGYLDLYSAMNGAGTINAVVDELGSFNGTSSTTPSVHTVAQPYRIYDSRPGPIPAAGTVTVVGAPTGSGANFTPASALGLVGNLSDINPAGQGYLVTFPAGGTVPGTASIANFPLQTRNTNNMVALNPTNGSFSIYAGGAATNSTYDVSAWIG